MSARSSDAQIRAAQYLRMSSDNQRYSTENQQNTIAEYAQQHGYSIVSSYVDAGKSGLSLKGRDALKQLLSDALAEPRTFDAILVLDISRWGRFQNPDQAAHYEFLCRQAGVRVVYCAEPFGEDTAPITTIIKHLKRVMAGEYSRELSVKLSRAKRQQAQLGFRQGGKLIYGFRRLLVDAERNPRQVLNSGEMKALSSDKVVVIPGPPEELAVIRRIFRMYVNDKLSIPEIAKRLAKNGIQRRDKTTLTRSTIRNILSNELCIGQLTYNVTTQQLQTRTLKNPEPLWTRFSAFDPIISLAKFNLARARLSRHRPWDSETIAKSLQSLLAQKGHLSQAVINAAEGVPAAETVVAHFGSLHAAYAAVGYQPTATRPFGINGKHWGTKAVLNGLQKLYRAQGRISTRLINGSPGLPSAVHIRRHFGSIPDAMRQAGLPLLSHNEIQRRSWTRRKQAGCDEYYLGVRWTDTKLLKALSELENGYGYVSANLINNNQGMPSTYYYAKRFGSLTKARAFAGLPLRTHSQIMSAALKRRTEGKTVVRQRRHPSQPPALRYRSEEILLGLERLANREGAISGLLIDEDTSLPSSATVAHHFGSLCKAYQLAGLIRLDGKLMRFGPPSQKLLHL